jgi:hypothetical protein
MARIYSNEGLIQNQSNSNAYMRIYSCGKNDSGPYYRFNILNNNPQVTLYMIHNYVFKSSDFNPGSVQHGRGFSFDTSGIANISGENAQVIQNSSPPIEYIFSTRQAIVCVGSTSSGLSNAKGSIISHIFCNRWDYVTITQL